MTDVGGGLMEPATMTNSSSTISVIFRSVPAGFISAAIAAYMSSKYPGVAASKKCSGDVAICSRVSLATASETPRAARFKPIVKTTVPASLAACASCMAFKVLSV